MASGSEDVLPQLSLHTPLGPLSVSEEDGALVALDWGWGRDQDETTLLCRAREQLHAYFDAELTQFSVPLAPVGTAFRRRVWLALADIPFGETCSYGALAARLHRALGGMDGAARGAARAIGGAVGRNPLPIILPCHRVVGARGLGGYSAGDGLASKRALLLLEHSARRLGGVAPPETRRPAGTRSEAA